VVHVCHQWTWRGTFYSSPPQMFHPFLDSFLFSSPVLFSTPLRMSSCGSYIVFTLSTLSTFTHAKEEVFTRLCGCLSACLQCDLYDIYAVVRVYSVDSVYFHTRKGDSPYSSIRLCVCMSATWFLYDIYAMWFLYDIYPVLRVYHVHSVYFHTRPRRRYTHSFRLRSAQHVVKSLGISRRCKSLCTNSTSD